VIIEFNLFVAMLAWSYIKCIITPPGYMPININECYSNADEIRESAKKRNIMHK